MSTAIASKLTLILASFIVWRAKRQGEVLLKEFNYSFPTLQRDDPQHDGVL